MHRNRLEVLEQYPLAESLIMHWEGLFLHAYQDEVGVWTIGYGTTEGIHSGMTCTKDQAIQWMRNEMKQCASSILSVIRAPVNSAELSAMISLTYNIGIGAFSHSTLVRRLNAGEPRLDVANEFLRWVYAGGRVLNGLVARRREERSVFLSGHTVIEAPIEEGPI